MGIFTEKPTMSASHKHDSHDHEHKDDHGNGHAHSHEGDACCSVKSVKLEEPAKASSCAPNCCSSEASTPQPLVSLTKPATSDGRVQTPIRIMQMDCPTEEGLLRTKLGGMAGVSGLEFNLMQRVLTVTHPPAELEPILAAVRSLGFTPEVATDKTSQEEPTPEPSKPWWPLALAGVAAIASEAVEWSGLPTWIAAVLALVAVLASGITTYKKGWIAIRNGNLNINALMSIAVTGALLIGQWPEAAMVMVLFTIAELIEAKSLDRARNAIRGLMQLTPERATVLQADGSWQDIPAKSVGVDARIRIKPGERIALDGKIVSGRSTINQAPITGESLPVEKAEGDQVFAGTINESGSFEYTVTAAANDSTLARIIHAVEEAQGARAPTQRFVDQFSRVYTPVVFAIAMAVAILPPLLMDGDWLAWIYKALVLLVIACPCALVISTPVTIVSGLAAAARKGILIKGGAFLEAGRSMKVLAVDKTGTLTYGKPAQTDFFALSSNDKHIHEIAISLAARSDHPVSLAIAHTNQEQKNDLMTVDSFEAILGRGVKGVIEGNLYYLGNHRLIEELGLCSDDIENRLLPLEQQGKTAVLLTNQTEVLAIIAVADTVRETSKQAIDELHQLGVTTIMLTGDNQHTAKAIGKQVGVDEIMGNLLPEDKLKIIDSRLKKDPNVKVGMVGDGINDAPALARASIGFAMGAAGTDTAIETADVALMDDDLRKIATFIRLSKSTALILTQNIVLALGIKAIFLVLTFTGQATMWMAVFADMGASLLVVANGLRLLRS